MLRIRGRPIRAPHPYDMIINGQGVMLGRPKKGAPLVATKPPDQAQVAPSDYGYSAANPIIERVQAYGALTGGMGLKLQKSPDDPQYFYTLNLDMSQGIPWLKGPAVSSVTPGTRDSTNGISHFFEIAGSLFALNGRYLLKRASDASYTASKDFGAGKAALDVSVFATNATGTNYAYIAMGDSELMYRFDGTTATQHASLYARAFGKVGRRFFRAHTTNLFAEVDVDADPWTAGDWSIDNIFTIGDKNAGITRILTTLADYPLILKTDGVYDLQGDGRDKNLYPYLAFATASDNGRYYAYFGNEIYLSFNRQTFVLTPQPTLSGSLQYGLKEIGPELLTENDSEVRGRITAMAAHANFALYAGLYNDDTGNSYLLKYGTMGEGGVRRNVWDGSITAAFASKKITALYVSTIGADTGHSRLYIGFSDGTISYFQLPCTENPAGCSNYSFSTADGTLYLPTFDGGFRNDVKVLKAVTVSGLNLSTTDFVEIQTRTDPQGSFGNLVDSGGTTIDFNQNPSQKVELSSGTQGNFFDLAVVLKTSSGTSPQVTGVGIHHAVRPPLVLVYQFDVLTDDGIARRDASVMRQSADDLRAAILTAARKSGPVQVTLPDETVVNLAVVAYEEATSWDDRSKQWRGSTRISAADFQSSDVTLQPVYGTYGRLEAYTYGEFEGFTYGQLETI